MRIISTEEISRMATLRGPVSTLEPPQEAIVNRTSGSNGMISAARRRSLEVHGCYRRADGLLVGVDGRPVPADFTPAPGASSVAGAGNSLVEAARRRVAERT